MSDPFAAEAAALASIQKRIADEWKRVETMEREYCKQGDYDAMRAHGNSVRDKMDKLYENRENLILSMPPFTTLEDGIRTLHPVTDENKHLLRGE